MKTARSYVVFYHVLSSTSDTPYPMGTNIYRLQTVRGRSSSFSEFLQTMNYN